MAWDDDLDQEQKQAASHVGCHACLVAGPGTGKTLVITRRIVYLVDEKGVDPDSIVALTFTRAAAAELRRRVAEELGEERSPRIWTLHSFALRQLLRNSELAPDILKPIRIADDWEERHIILEDLANTLGIDVRQARQKLWSLSAAWESLRADAEGWPEPSPDPKFIGAWEEHRLVYGYALRAELVYRLKLAVEQYEGFDLEGASGHVLVDEYQDLNRCDLAVVRALVDRGAELFAAGDDDQSIYGFRRAYPQGIREFLQDYPGGVLLKLRVTKRCDPQILKLGQFVAE